LHSSTIYCKQWYFSFSFNCWFVISFNYHTHFMVLGLTLFDNSLVVLKLCFLNLVATKFTYLELHRVIFGVSRILLIADFQGLLNILLTNHWVNLWKSSLEWAFSNLHILEKLHGMCKHHLVVVFHILLWNVYSLFQYCKTFFIYLCIHPLPGHPFICLSIVLFHSFPHVLIFNKCWRGSNRLSFLWHFHGFVSFHILSSMFESNVYSIIDSNVFGVKIDEIFPLTIVK